MATSASGRPAQECGGGGGGVRPGQLAGDHRDLHARRPSQARDVAVPQHGEVRLDELVLGGQVQPDLEELQRVRPLGLEQREHLGVDDALAGGEPLHVAPTEAGGGAERVGVVDQAPCGRR